MLYTARMTPSQIDLYSLQIDCPLPRPRPLEHEDVRKFSDWLCDPEGFRLRPDQVKMKVWDKLYGYEIFCQFFGENGFLVRTPDRVRVGVKNARTAADWEIIQQVFVKFLHHIAPAEGAFSNFSATAHVKLEEPFTTNGYLSRFAVIPGVERPAALNYVKIADWEKEVRLVIEPSNLIPGQLFISWDSQFSSNSDWDTFVPTFITVMENSARVLELSMAPLR
jgi:hypothetical protein